MLYDAYEMQRSLLAGASTLANIGAGWLQNPANPFAYSQAGPIVASALDVFAHAAAPRGKPRFRPHRDDGRRPQGRGPRGDRASQAVRPAQAFPPRRREGRAEAADRRADVGPLCDSAARHRRADAAGPRRLHHRLARREAGAARRGPLRSRRLYRLSDRIPREDRAGRAHAGGLPAVGARLMPPPP